MRTVSNASRKGRSISPRVKSPPIGVIKLTPGSPLAPIRLFHDSRQRAVTGQPRMTTSIAKTPARASHRPTPVMSEAQPGP